MVKENSVIKMEEFTMGIGNLELWMDMESFIILKSVFLVIYNYNLVLIVMENLLMKDSGGIMLFMDRVLYIIKNLY